jgi:hypothetical protein
VPVVAFILLLAAIVLFLAAAYGRPSWPTLPLGLAVLAAALIFEFARLGPRHHF